MAWYLYHYGTLENGAHVTSILGYLICSRHSIFSPKRAIFIHVLSYLRYLIWSIVWSNIYLKPKVQAFGYFICVLCAIIHFARTKIALTLDLGSFFYGEDIYRKINIWLILPWRIAFQKSDVYISENFSVHDSYHEIRQIRICLTDVWLNQEILRKACRIRITIIATIIK